MNDILSGFLMVASSALGLYVCYRIAKMFWDESHPDKQSIPVTPVSVTRAQQLAQDEGERYRAFSELFPDAGDTKPPVDEENQHLVDSVNYAARGLAGGRGGSSPVPMYEIVGLVRTKKSNAKLETSQAPPTTKPPTKAEWKKMIKDGMSVSAMAKATGIHRSSVYRQIDKLGLKTQNDGPKRPKKIDEETRQNIIDDVAAGTLTNVEVAKKYGVHRDTIWKIINKRAKS